LKRPNVIVADFMVILQPIYKKKTPFGAFK